MKIAAKFEDWTPPWKEGEIDEAVVARLVYNLQFSEQEKTSEIRALKSENTTLTEANEVFKAASEKAKSDQSTEVQKAVAEAEAARDQAVEKLKTATRENDLLKVRVEYPAIDDEDIERLRGDDLDSLLEDAKKFAEKHGLTGETTKDDEHEDDDSADLSRQPQVRRHSVGDPGGPIDSDMGKAIEQRRTLNPLIA